jgi:hypothetical protein
MLSRSDMVVEVNATLRAEGIGEVSVSNAESWERAGLLTLSDIPARYTHRLLSIGRLRARGLSVMDIRQVLGSEGDDRRPGASGRQKDAASEIQTHVRLALERNPGMSQKAAMLKVAAEHPDLIAEHQKLMRAIGQKLRARELAGGEE